MFSKDGISSISNAKITSPIPAGERDGRINAYSPADGFHIFIIDIHAATIPNMTPETLPPGRIVKINYCEHGRCELMTKTGEYTYLVGGEVAVDTGQAENSFYYPTSDYVGVELVAFMDDSLREIPSLKAYSGVLRNAALERVDAQPRPLIFPADETVERIASEMRSYDEMDLGSEMLLLKGLELVVWLAQQLPEKQNTQRQFYTRSQVEIAQRCFDLINEDLGKRWTAKALSERFGVSETSIKNYFRNVYGYGFLEYQNKVRMEYAADRLTNGEESAREIARAVGYASQTKFGEAFRDYHGCLPLEYRRRKRIK